MSDKQPIMRDAFDHLFKNGKFDELLKPGNPYLERKEYGRPVPTNGSNKGNIWTCKGCSGCILLEVDDDTLKLIEDELKAYNADKSKPKSKPKPHYYIKNKKLVKYTSTLPVYADKVFLLFEDWHPMDSGLTLIDAICDAINKIMPGTLSVDNIKIMRTPEKDLKSTSGSSKKKTTLPTPKISKPEDDAMPLNFILYGPPGTGKTYNTIFKTLDILGEGALDKDGKPTTQTSWFDNKEADRKRAIDKFNKRKEDGRIVFTTFHQSMSYEDFIEGIKPILNNEGKKKDKAKTVGYKIEDGLFKKIAAEADKETGKKNPKKYVLIIDEINRGNVANIFGELITLIEDDKRKTKFEGGKYVDNPEGITVKLPYSKEDFGVPGNLYIIGTMNTADRSVEALDSALRRRFSFVEMMPKPELLDGVEINGLGKYLKDLLTTINERIEVLKDREHQIGHSYFMKFTDEKKYNNKVEPDQLKEVFTDKIIPLLQEYFYGDYEKIRLVLGSGFVKEESGSISFAGGALYDEAPQKRYSIEKEPNMSEALKTLLNI